MTDTRTWAEVIREVQKAYGLPERESPWRMPEPRKSEDVRNGVNWPSRRGSDK